MDLFNKIVVLFNKFVAFSNKIVDFFGKIVDLLCERGVLPHLENPPGYGPGGEPMLVSVKIMLF